MLYVIVINSEHLIIENDKINHVFRHADSRYFCSPLFGAPSLGALGSCPSRLPLDPPLPSPNHNVT